MDRERQIQDDVSELPQESALRSIPISVKVVSRLRRGSGGVPFPSAPERVRSSDSTSSTSSLGGSRARSGSLVGHWVKSTLYLTETMLSYEVLGEVCTVLLEDLIGVQVIPKPPPNNPNACEFDINYYPKVARRGGQKVTRKLELATVQFDSESVFKDNLLQAVDWKKAVNIQTKRALRKIFFDADISSLQLSEDDSVLVPRHLLVFLNPVSGSGKTVSDFKKHIQPLFDLAEIHYQLIVTERQNHAREIMRTFDVTSISGIVISSGDGLLFEVVNGLMERKDWEMAIKVPIGMLPTGSGNALVASTLHESGEEFSLLNAAFQIIRGGVVPLDIATVETGDGEKCYMSLLASWGLVADIDIESEKFRKIGETRFVLGALNCIIKKRLYQGKMSYLPYEAETIEQSTTRACNSNIPEQSDTAKLGGEDSSTKRVTAEVDKDGINEAATEEASPSTTQQTGTPPVDINNSAQVEMIKSEATESEQPATNEASTHIDSQHPPQGNQKLIKQYGPKADLLPPLSQPVPNNWVTLEQEFMAVTILMISHMAHNFIGDPDVSIGMGKLRILICDGQISRLGMFGMLTKAETGQHVEMEGVTRTDVKALRLEPHTAPGMLTIDGEEVYYGPIQVQIHPALARVMCRKRRV